MWTAFFNFTRFLTFYNDGFLHVPPPHPPLQLPSHFSFFAAAAAAASAWSGFHHVPHISGEVINRFSLFFCYIKYMQDSICILYPSFSPHGCSSLSEDWNNFVCFSFSNKSRNRDIYLLVFFSYLSLKLIYATLNVSN